MKKVMTVEELREKLQELENICKSKYKVTYYRGITFIKVDEFTKEVELFEI